MILGFFTKVLLFLSCFTFQSGKNMKTEAERAFKKANVVRSTLVKKANESMRIVITISVGIILGFFIGVSFPSLPTKLNVSPTFGCSILGNESIVDNKKPMNVSVLVNNKQTMNVSHSLPVNSNNSSNGNRTSDGLPKEIWVPSNPKGAERLPPGIVASESDFYTRRLWGKPSEDLTSIPKYLVTFTVGYDQRDNINAAVKKFSNNFTIVLFHYDGRTNEWDNEFEWSKRAIHVSVKKQTKWWYAKRFLHPDIVAPYDYIFIWDEDLGVKNFDAEEYIKIVKKHGLEISQPGLDPSRGITWQMTKRRPGVEAHLETEERPGWCSDPHLPPCAAFVEIMAPVFSRDAWRCVWHMIQNDLVHGWGLDLALQKCVEPANEKIGVVDAQWIVHQGVPSLGNQGQSENGKTPWQGVRERCRNEWAMFRSRMENAEKAYYNSIKMDSSNFTTQTYSKEHIRGMDNV
ncbi:uncharacterized protein LOC142522593 isoform X1 [Primulina tabacum]|uniref:uncharacterized protein LOC142522593 isoform X1 n=2 Tax=Primulina tabacum TaxID=48773 RepID=UPI003F591443